MEFVTDHSSRPPFVDRTYGEPLFHTQSEVVVLCFAPDDSLWSIEESGILRQWTREGRLMTRKFLAELDAIWAFNSDATLIASACDKFINIWDAARARVQRRMPTDSWVMALAFSLDGKLLASGHDNGTVRLWDVSDGKLVAEWKAHNQSVSAIDFRNTQIATAGEDRLIHVWDFAGKKAATLAGHFDRIPALAWQPGGNLLISAGWVWDPSKSDPLILLNSHADQVANLAYSRDGRLLAVADSDFTIHVWSDLLHCPTEYVLQGHKDEIRAMAFSRDGSRLATAGADCVVQLWDMNTGRLAAGPNPANSPNSPSRHGIALVNEQTIVSTAGAAIQGWEQESARPSWVPLCESGEPVLSIATSPDGKWLATGGPSPEVKVWDLATRELKLTLQHTRGPIVNLTFSPNSELLVSASISDGLAWVWRIGNPEPILVIPEAAETSTLESLAFHPTKNWLAVGGIDWLATSGSDGAVCLWDLDAQQKIASVPTGVTSLAFDPTGRFIAAGTLKQTVAIWEIKDLNKVFEPQPRRHGGRRSRRRSSRRERRPASGRSQSARPRWHRSCQRVNHRQRRRQGDPGLGSRFRQAEPGSGGHQDRIGAVLFSPDGRWLVSAGDDCTLRIWDVLNGQLVAARQFDAAIHSLAFSKNGRYLYTGNDNTTCYRLELKKLLEG
jgi:WD40 repeat protein